VPENPRPPPTVRITRPWTSEKEFIDGDLAYLGRTAILLPNAPAREAGELIRFEIVLSTGVAVFRGEGHVVVHHPPGGPKPPGLEVRFTRIDARSKLLLDRVRERRTALVRSGSMPPPALVSHAPPPMTLSLGPPPLIMSQAPPTRLDPGLPPAATVRSAETEAAIVRAKERGPLPPPPNREEILSRLRERAKRLTASRGGSVKKA
jgi:hypothetical protein